jgi:hypothetical protein
LRLIAPADDDVGSGVQACLTRGERTPGWDGRTSESLRVRHSEFIRSLGSQDERAWPWVDLAAAQSRPALVEAGYEVTSGHPFGPFCNARLEV